MLSASSQRHANIKQVWTIQQKQTKMKKFNGHKNSKITSLSKDLRNNMTKEERHLWFDFLQNLPVRITRRFFKSFI